MAGEEEKAPLHWTGKPSDFPMIVPGNVPAIYADAIRGTLVMSETAKINLVEHRQNVSTMQMESHLVGVIILPTSQLAAWGTYFTMLAADIEAAESDV